MSDTLTLQRDVVSSKIAAILLATGATLACFALFGLTRSLVFPTSSANEPGIHPRAAIPQFEVIPNIAPTLAVVPTALPHQEKPYSEVMPVPTIEDQTMQYTPPPSLNSGNDLSGCIASPTGGFDCADGRHILGIDRYGNAIMSDASQATSFAVEPIAIQESVSKSGFRTGSGLRKDK